MTTLTVSEAVQKDVGRHVARLSGDLFSALKLESGDTIEIKGKKTTVASVRRGFAQDDETIIRIDGNLRRSAGVSVGEKVEVKKANPLPAKSIELVPIHEIGRLVDPNDLLENWLIEKPLTKDSIIEVPSVRGPIYYFVVSSQPKGFVIVKQDTQLNISGELYSERSEIPEIKYEDIGGLKREIEQIREMVELPIRHPEVFERVGISAPKGLLLTGPPGTGKTLLAKAVASESEAQFFSIAGPEVVSKFYGESEKQLREIFEKANKAAPSIIFIDELDSIASSRNETQGEVERRMVATLLTMMDGLKSRGQVIVIAATNRPDAIDSALRRPGRFDREITVGVPDEEGRHEILQIHTRGMPIHEDVNLRYLAERTMGFTGADIEALCKESAMKSLKNYIPDLQKHTEKVPVNVLEKIKIKKEHFDATLQHLEPSAMREVLIQRPKTKWNDIGGLENVKEQLKEAVIWPMTHPEYFKQAGIRPPKGILLHGPPGTGKTLLAKAIANEARANFISVKGPELISKWVGESEKHVREIFKRARQVAPAVIFFDEFDAISSMRGHSMTDATERVVNQLLTEMDGIEELEKVIVVAATNRADLIDPGLLRPGRIDLKLEIGLPDEGARLDIFRVHAKNMPLEKNVDLKELAKQLSQVSGADIEGLCREAGMEAIREAIKTNSKKIKVTHANFIRVIENFKNKQQNNDNPLVR